MQNLSQKTMPARKASAFGGARKRIVKTDRQLSHSNAQLRETKHSLDNLSDYVSEPLKQGFLLEMQHNIGRRLADLVTDKIKEAIEENPEIIEMLMPQAMNHIARDTGNNMAAILCDMIFPRAEYFAEPSFDHQRMERTTIQTVVFPETVVSHCQPNRRL